MKTLIWDWPIRIFHAAFSLCLALALLFSFLIDDDSPFFALHMLFGLSAGFLLIVRIVVGIAGARYSRLRGLVFSPRETLVYLAMAPLGKARRYVGHNPGIAAIALAMFGMVIGIIWTGLTMSSDFSEDLHELLAYGLLAAIGAHLAGMLLHTIHHRENIALGMFNGKQDCAPEQAIASSKPFAGLLILLILGLWAGLVARGFDQTTATLTLPGLGSLRLGEHGDDNAGRERHGGERRHDDD